MPADTPSIAPRQARRSPRARRGVAFIWAIIGITITSLIGVAIISLSSADALVNENYDAGTRATYAADQGLSLYLAEWRPAQSLLDPVTVTVSAEQDDKDDEFEGEVLDDYEGADPKMKDFEFQQAWVRITPLKLVESQRGDLYVIEAEAEVIDQRRNRPPAVRELRTYAEMRPPVVLRAAWNAPNGLYSSATSERLSIDGNKTGKCGIGQSITPLATPRGLYRFQNKKRQIKTAGGQPEHDSTAASHQELLDSLRVPWGILTDAANYRTGTNAIVIPRDYPSLQAIPWNSIPRNRTWPVVLVQGNVPITSDVKGFGMLVVNGRIDITAAKLTWSGLIMTAQGFSITDGSGGSSGGGKDDKGKDDKGKDDKGKDDKGKDDKGKDDKGKDDKGNGDGKAHLHATGAVVTGIACSSAPNVGSPCRSELNGEHLGLKYNQCVVEAAWSSMLMLAPLTGSRHLRLF